MGIIGGLLMGWILGLFGFKGVVIAGMAQLFHMHIDVIGYYFIFALLGFVGYLIRLIKSRQVNKGVEVN